jgi:sugar lactone lactonase YvrE
MNAGQDQQTLSHFATGAHGNVAPIATITGTKTGLVQTRGLAITPDDENVWVATAGDKPAIEEFGTSQRGNVSPARTITGSSTKLGTLPYGVAVDSAGEVIVSTDSPAAIATFSPDADGNVAPKRLISGSATHVSSPSFMTLDAVGNIWTENYSSNNVVRFAPAATGNVAPTRLLSGANTQIGFPNAVAVYSATPGAPRKVVAHGRSHHRVSVTWKAPASDGGGIVGYTAYVQKSAHGKWGAAGTTTNTSLTITHLAAKKAYRIAVAATNNSGTSTRSAPASIS